MQEGLKPEKLSLENTPAEHRAWAARYRAFHSTSNLQRLSAENQQAYFFSCLDKQLEVRLRELVNDETAIFGEDSCMARLEAEFLLRHPLFTRRLDFFRAEQKPNEEFSNFAIRLRQLGDEADLQNLRTDELYVFKYVCGCTNTALRGKFLKNPDPTLQELKAIARAFEIAEQSTAAMSAKPQGQQINQIGSRPQQQQKQQPQQQQQGKQRGRPWFSIPDRIMGKCSRCGSSSHGKADCKAEPTSVTCDTWASLVG